MYKVVQLELCVVQDIGYNFKIMENKGGYRFLHLAYSKKFYLLPYSTHLLRHRESGLIRPVIKSLKKLPNY